MEDDVKTLGDYLSIAWRRKFYILIPFIVVLMITVATVFLLPPVYKSTGTILIESQQIPSEMIQSTVTTFADERIQVIKQRIMTSQQLFSIIRKFDLYALEIKTTPRSEILEDMRKRIEIDRVSANLKSQRNRNSAIIAFTVSFEHQSAVIAQKIANELVTLFLDENIRSRTARAEETSDFLKKESERLGAQISEMGAQIASYKQENAGMLPESLPVNLQRLLTLRSTQMNSEAELNALKERKQLLQIDLETLQYNVATGSGGLNEEQLRQKQELQELQNRFISLSARYGAEHPDVKAIQRQVSAFQQEYGDLSDIAELQSQQQAVRQEIVDLTGKYSSEHPDVKRLERKLEGIDAMIEKSENSGAPEQAGEQPANEASNPELMQVKARLESVDNGIERLSKARIEIQQQIAELDTRINRTPQVERGLDALERDYENTKRKYEEMKNKQLQAELSQSLEEEQKGERFTLLEPPLRPDKPVKPNRPKLFMLGLILAMVGGIGVAGVAETVDGGIRGSRALASVTKMTPLVTIPFIVTRKDELRRKRNIKLFIVALFVLGIAAVAAVHFLYKPLDLLWFIVLRKLNLT
jgi:uncharacterized protein involved in exopolysaccharide biosynthesis